MKRPFLTFTLGAISIVLANLTATFYTRKLNELDAITFCAYLLSVVGTWKVSEPRDV